MLSTTNYVIITHCNLRVGSPRVEVIDLDRQLDLTGCFAVQSRVNCYIASVRVDGKIPLKTAIKHCGEASAGNDIGYP